MDDRSTVRDYTQRAPYTPTLTGRQPRPSALALCPWATRVAAAAMGILARIAAGVLTISFMTFVAFFGRLPALR